jgi:hypothetical protein
MSSGTEFRRPELEWESCCGKSAPSDCIYIYLILPPLAFLFVFVCTLPPRPAILGLVNCGARRKKTEGITVNGFSRLKMQSERENLYTRGH